MGEHRKAKHLAFHEWTIHGKTSVHCAGKHNSVWLTVATQGAAAESTCSLAKAKAAPLMLTKTPFVYSLPHVLSFLQPTSLSRWKTCVFCTGLHKWHGLLCGHFYRLYNLSSLKAYLDEYQCNFSFNLIFEAKTDSLFFYSAKQVPDPRLSRH